jgi:hypothetical protein
MMTRRREFETLAAPASNSAALMWRLLGSRAGRTAISAVCAAMRRRLERLRGAAAVESREAIFGLWHIEAWRQVSRAPQSTWRLRDGTMLAADDPVLELHIATDMLVHVLGKGTPWRVVVEREFRSLVPALRDRHEIALVGSTILRRQVLEFGAAVREVPLGMHRTLDTFYRKLILVAFHPRGAGRAIRDHEHVVEAAISRADFCRRFGHLDAPDRA